MASLLSSPGEVVVITGCSSGGIGYSLCEQFAARGCRVFATARRMDSMPGLQEQGIQLVRLDVTSSESIREAINTIVQDAGRIDILINNAGVVCMGPTAEVPMDIVKQTFDANVFGLLEMCQAVFPQMAAQGSGKIVNIGSMTGLQPVPLRGIYSATKGAVRRLSDALRIELRPLGIQVMYMAPGFIDTRARDNAQRPDTSKSLWGDWFSALQAALKPRLDKAVPADLYAKQVAGVVLQRRLPRIFIGKCAGLEWTPQYLPLWLADLILYKAMGLHKVEPVLISNAEALAAQTGITRSSKGSSGNKKTN